MFQVLGVEVCYLTWKTYRGTPSPCAHLESIEVKSYEGILLHNEISAFVNRQIYAAKQRQVNAENSF